MFHVVSGLVGLYLIWRYVFQLKLSVAARVALSLLLLAFIEHHWLVSRHFGTMASPEIPGALIMVLGAVFGALILFACMLLLRDVAGVIAWCVSRPLGRKVLGQTRVAHGLAGLAAVLGAVGVWQAVRVPEVRTLEITVRGLPAAFEGYRIVHLTDLHTSRLLQGPWMRAVVERANALEPALVVISGDLVDGTPQARANDYPPLAGLRARDGVYGVPGNHEYYAAYGEWMQVFRDLGIRMLVDEHVLIRQGDAALVLAGVADQVGPTRGEIGPDIVQALAGRPAGAPVLLMDHRPGNARANRAAGADIQLSGHTHGGHALGLNLIVARANQGFVSGRYHVDGMTLYVSNGAGLWPGFPIRLGVPSEITQIMLRGS